jgi:hypothetical protein
MSRIIVSSFATQAHFSRHPQDSNSCRKWSALPVPREGRVTRGGHHRQRHITELGLPIPKSDAAFPGHWNRILV